MIYDLNETKYINQEALDSLDFFLNEMCASADCYNESVVDDIKHKIVTTKDLWDQWQAKTGNFVTHKWIYRYINDDQKKALEKHYQTLCDDNVYYSTYKRSFQAIQKFMGISGNVIIENIAFNKDKQDKDQWVIAIKYSKGLLKINIPDGVHLIHVTTHKDEMIKDGIIPAFRSKTKGKYLYPTKRCFFTIGKDIGAGKAGFGKQKTERVTPKEEIKTAYIDPTYNDFGTKSVYVETEAPIAVEAYEKKMTDIFKM